jgi:hypothetical protein
MRTLIALAVAMGLVAAALIVGEAIGADAKTPKPTPDQPKSRADWPTEHVTVVGRRGSLRDWIVNQTLRGSEGFADGSAPPDVVSRTEFPWQIYYSPDGKLEAHFRRLAARVPHGAIEEVDFVDYGTWRVTENDDLCQTIPHVGWGTEVCYWLDRRGTRIAMYYSDCGAFYRCYPGRLGPEGEMFPGRSFTR